MLGRLACVGLGACALCSARVASADPDAGAPAEAAFPDPPPTESEEIVRDAQLEGSAPPPAPPDAQPPVAPYPPAYPPWPRPPHGPPAGVEPAEPTEPEMRWYGWQTLITDGAAIVLLFAGIDSESGELIGAAALTYYLGAPIVHWSHGQVGKGFASLGIRLGGTLLAVAVISSCFDDPSCSETTVAVVGLGALIAPIPIDAAALAREPVEPETPKLGLVPIYTPSVRGLGFGGSF